MRERGRSAALLVLMACTSENGAVDGTGEAPNQANPPPLSTSLLPPDMQPEQETPDGGPVGLEFDPSSGRFIIPEAGPPPPKPLRSDSVLATDALGREEQLGVVLEAHIRQRGVPSPPKGPEVDSAGIAAAAKLTAQNLTVTLTAVGRMKMVVQSRSLPLPFQSELRARFDRLGYIALWPGLAKYRVVPSGALRAAIGERRIDVTPLVPGQKSKTATGRHLELPTRSIMLESPLGKLRLDLATVAESGLGGPLLCRFWVETVGIDPSTPECKPDEVPLGASIDWEEGGGIDFDASSIEKRTDMPPGEVLVPPSGATAVNEGLPDSSDGIYLTQDELKAFRSREVEVKADTGAPLDGFTADNGRDRAMTLYLDGVPVVTVPALEKRFVIGPRRGHYMAQWRTFLGDRIESAQLVDIPGVLRSAPLPVTPDAGP
jgi:hypothetical protein